MDFFLWKISLHYKNIYRKPFLKCLFSIMLNSTTLKCLFSIMVNYFINRTIYIVGDAIVGLRVYLIYVMYSDCNKYVEVPYDLKHDHIDLTNNKSGPKLFGSFYVCAFYYNSKHYFCARPPYPTASIQLEYLHR